MKIRYPSRWGYSEKRRKGKDRLRGLYKTMVTNHGWVRNNLIERSMEKEFGKLRGK